MAQNQNIPTSTREMQDFNIEAAKTNTVLLDLAKSISDNAKAAARFTGESAAAYTESFSGAVDLAKELQGLTLDDIKSKETQESLARSINRVAKEKVLIQAKIALLQDKVTNATGAEKVFAQDALTELQDAEAVIEETLGSARSLTREYQLQNNEVNKQIGSWKTISTTFATGIILKGLAAADERITAIRKGLNATREESQKLAENFATAAQGMNGLSAKDLESSALGLSNAMGTVGVVSARTAGEMATQVKFMGLAAEESNKLAQYTEATGQDSKDLGDSIRGQVILSNKRNKTAIDYKAVLKDVANTSNATKLLMKGQGNNLASATIEAKKLGTTMEGIANVSKSLLNFEDSIANELEAELLTGKELNNEKARMYALTGNQEGLAKEITKNQVLQKFESAKTVLEQDAIAKAYGMSSETMADMVVQSKALASFGAKTKTELTQNYQKRLQEVEAMQDGAEKEKARLKLTKDIGGEAAEQQQKAMTLAENQALVFEKLGDAMTALAPILEPLKDVLVFIGHYAKIATAALLVIGSVGFASQIGKVVGNLSNLGGVFAKLKMPSAGAGGAGGGGMTSMVQGFSKINTTDLIKGAAAMLIAAGAIFVFGKGVQELEKIKDWGRVAIGLGLFAASMGVMAVIATLASGPLYVMAPAMIAFGAAVALMGLGLNLATPGIDAFGTVVTKAFTGLSELVAAVADAFVKMLGAVTTDKLTGLLLLGPALLSIAAGLGAVAIAGALAIPAIAGMTVMSIAAPKIVDLAETFGLSQKSETKGATRGEGGGTSMEAVVKKIDELIEAVKQGGNIHIGANKLNEAIGINLHPMR
jgi:hypothetical protein